MIAMVGRMCITPASTISVTPPGQLVFRTLPEFALRLDLRLAWRSQYASHFSAELVSDLNTAIDRHQSLIAQPNCAGAIMQGMKLFEA